MNKLVCLVGMCGSGKSIVADKLVANGFGFLRFGQLTLDIVKERIANGEVHSESMEKEVREGLRKEHGMGAYAKLNIPKFEELLKKGNVVGDGLYSWTEYKILKEHFKDNLVVISVYAPPKLRHTRISQRVSDANDKDMRNRSITVDEAKKRDHSEIENIEKGGPIAMADYTIINTSTIESVYEQLNTIAKNENFELVN